MEKKEIILVGGGGHCKSCIDVIEQEGVYKIAGIVDVKEKVGEKILGYSIIATDDEIEQLGHKYDYFLITLGQIKSADLREKLFDRIRKLGKNTPAIISPRAYVSNHAIAGDGTIIMHDVVVNSDVNVGENCILNTKSLIEHEVMIGNHCHISTAAVINGNVTIGNSSTIGSSSTVIQNIRIGDKVIIGAGSIVIKDALNPGIYIGAPAKIKKQ